MRRDLAALEAYDSSSGIAATSGCAEAGIAELARPPVKLDANENPYGPSPRVAEALAQARLERYPDPECTELRQHLGAYLGVDPARIVCGVGGDEVLDLLLRIFLDPGDEVVDCTPSFSMYELTTTYNRGKIVRVPRGEGFAVDVPAVERALSDRTKVIVVCSPNNPTGNSTPTEDIIRLLETGRLVLLDEAYAEFAGRTLVHLGEGYPNLAVLRTMSKWAALAALRLGYLVVDPVVAQEIGKIKSPYNLGIAAQVAGMVSLQDAVPLMENVRKIVAERERLYARLVALPYGAVYPSETNFLYWTTGPVPALALKAALAQRGVLVRAFQDPVDALRISVGRPEESDALMGALEESYVELAG
jgi:histidinol-phosphate aminotransferase